MDLAHGGDDFRQRDLLRPPAVVLIPGFVDGVLRLAESAHDHSISGQDRARLQHPRHRLDGVLRRDPLVLDGNAPLIFDGDRFTDFLNTNFAGWLSKPLESRPWAYPPSFLLILLPLAPLGFFGSYVAFQVVTGALMALALRSQVRQPPCHRAPCSWPHWLARHRPSMRSTVRPSFWSQR